MDIVTAILFQPDMRANEIFNFAEARRDNTMWNFEDRAHRREARQLFSNKPKWILTVSADHPDHTRFCMRLLRAQHQGVLDFFSMRTERVIAVGFCPRPELFVPYPPPRPDTTATAPIS